MIMEYPSSKWRSYYSHIPAQDRLPKIMAAAATNSSIFSLFSSLCPELRTQIWRDALPDGIGPALYSYKKGCWCPRRLIESDEGYDPNNDELNLNLEFRHDLLDNIQYHVSLVFVNREARGIAMAWVRQQGLKIQPREDRQGLVFVRSFDPMHDALYIALDRWEDFLNEHYDRQAEPDLLLKLVNVVTNITYIAVPEALLRSETSSLNEMIWLFSRIEVLFIIVDAPPDLQCADNDIKVQRRWELESTQGGSFLWNLDSGGFDLGNSEHIGDKTLYRLIEEANKQGLGRELTYHHIHRFEIRPVFAVGR